MEQKENYSDKELNKYTNDPLEKPGLIKKAKEHGNAQRLLHIPSRFAAQSKYYFFILDVEFCECCNLPIETPGIIDKFPLCVDIKELGEGGVGTFLYFYFFKYIIFSLMLILGISVIPMIILNKSYSKDIVQFCTPNLHNITACMRYNSTNLVFNQSEWLYEMSYDQVNKSFLILNELYPKKFANKTVD